MSSDSRFGAKSFGARFAGLGIATAVAFAVGGVPAIALADESTDALGETPVVTAADDAVVATEGQPVAANEGDANLATDVASATAPTITTPTTLEVTAPATGDAVAGAGQTGAGSQDLAGGVSEAEVQPQAGDASQTTSQTGDADADEGGASAAISNAAESLTSNSKQAAAATPETTPSRSIAADSGVAAERVTANTVSGGDILTTASPSEETKTVTTSQAASSSSSTTLTNVYRLYNPNSGEHFYTVSLDEATSVFSAGWRWEEAVYLESPSDGSEGSDVYRVYNPNAGAHFYTVSSGERDHLVSLGWRYEGISWRASGSSLLYRLYNPNSPIGEHLYTASAEERDDLIDAGWNDEGTAWAYVPGFREIAGRWVVSSAYGSQERYWVASDAKLAKSRFVETSEGSGYRAYAKSDGAVVRGLYKVSSTQALIANNDGKLETTQNGIAKTSAYTGSEHLYYLKNGYVQLGEFSANGKNYYGRTDTGYLVVGNYFNSDTGKMYRGNSEGALEERNTQVDRYVDWALAIAMDNSHGYSQIYRNDGTNYDCSSLVIAALKQAGYQTGGATYTGNMYSELRKYGWYSVSPNAANLQYGDILLNDGHHTAIYLSNGWLVHASADENGSWEGYISGDQTGREICYRTYYNYPWTRFLRHS